MRALRDALSRLPRAVFADLLESDEAYLLLFDVPGATPETTELSVRGGRLRVEARRDKRVPAGFEYHREDRSLFLDAELPLPPDAVGEDASASLTGGVLEVRIPKAATGGTRIEIE